ncbi:splicing factor, suppressor of white-apricot homolog isoform X2 [Dermacentor andersoni]|uniref:splicing factor, suppressor of white-apricot homolog isoform X2 n=1 Tax=Dermacentor andersoni TaxID=34620 RepID=UPI003B3BAB77
MAASANGRTWAASGERSGKSDDDLLVFGYSCKLFRDDEKAMHIDRGKHLIPWMGDDSLMIDRYDARGYLHSIHEYEPKPGAALQYIASLTEEEKALEELCEEERFLALFRDLHEESIYQEEELKRLNVAMNADGTYKETAFSYDSENSALESQEDDIEVPFKAPKGLHIPVSVPTPPTMKLHAIIEKTALFVSQHGAQMEILVKTKQAGNPQFSFLSFDHPLNVYYRFLVEQIKCGTYIPVEESTGNEESDDEDDHYLHPSLFATSAPAVPVAVSKVFLSKEGEENAYSQLIKNLKPQLDSPSGGASPCPPQEAANHGSAYGYTDGAGYEGYGAPEDCSVPPPPPGLEPILLPSQAVLTGYAIPPPPDVQPIIDKMAVYVAKNGEDFETIVKSKGDKRFEFLLPDHEYHQYYLHKKQTYLSERAQQQQEEQQQSQEPGDAQTESEDKPKPAENDEETESVADAAESTEEHYDVVGPKLENGLSVGDDGSVAESQSDSPFSNIDSNDTNSQPALVTPSDRLYNKGPVSFTLKLKDLEGKDKKRLPLHADESDSEGPAEATAPAATAAPTATTPTEESAKVVEKAVRDKNAEGASSKDRLSPARQLQMERKKRLAKFLSMIKDSQGVSAAGSTSATSARHQHDGSKGSSGTSTPKEPASRLADVSRAPTDSLPASPATNTARERSNDRAASPEGISPRHRLHKSSSKSRHRSRSPTRHRHRHHRHGRDASRSQSRERHHRKHHRSPRQGASKRSHSKSPSPVRRSKARRSRSRSPVRRK